MPAHLPDVPLVALAAVPAAAAATAAPPVAAAPAAAPAVADAPAAAPAAAPPAADSTGTTSLECCFDVKHGGPSGA